MTSSGIRSTLESIGVVDSRSVYRFADRTRDRDVPVLRDRVSGVIFIEDHYVGDAEYERGEYRGDEAVTLVDIRDCDRRLRELESHFVDKRIIDFGCGRGLFLVRARELAREVHGVELQASFRELLEAEDVACSPSLGEAPVEVDSIFMFHALEHLPEPLETLRSVREHLRPEGCLVVEVPHARDILLDYMCLGAFRDFTLWSQHLVLHTRESLRRLLEAAGFSRISIMGVQRYGLGNHLHWLTEGSPSGHASHLGTLESSELRTAYANALAAHDLTDALVATAYA